MKNYRQVASSKSYLSGLGSGRSQGEAYAPNVYNDEGIYTHFYVDFLSDMLPFSFGMVSESLIVLGGSNAIPITGFEKINNRKYKCIVNISNQELITFINKKTGWLCLDSGESLPAFSTGFIPFGIYPTFRPAYAYENIKYENSMNIVEMSLIDMWNDYSYPNILETIDSISIIEMKCEEIINIKFT